MSPSGPQRHAPHDQPAPRSAGGQPGGPGPVEINPAGVAAFAVEVAMIALVAVSGWRLGSSAWLSPLLCVVLVVVVAVLWGLWLAPRAARRLPTRARVVAKAVLFAAVGGLALAAGIGWWGLVFVVLAWASLAWTRG